MSGTASASWSLVQDPVHYAVQLAAQLNCSLPRNMLQHHSQIISCLRAKPLSDLYSVQLTAPSFLIAMGPSRDGVLIPSDFGTTVVSFGKRSASPVFRVILGVTENEARDLFSEEELEMNKKSVEKTDKKNENKDNDMFIISTQPSQEPEKMNESSDDEEVANDESDR